MRPYVRDYRFPLGIKPERWEALKDEHKLHPDETPDATVMVKFNRYDEELAEPEEQVTRRKGTRVADPELEHAEGMTLQKVADHFGLTRERIRQIEIIAFRKLRKRARLLNLSLEDLSTMGLAMDNRE